MKKVIILSCIIVGLFLAVSLRKEEVKQVSFSYNVNFNLEDYNLFYLDLAGSNITTNNLKNYINNMEVISISLYINPSYDKVGNIEYSFVSNISFKRNMDKLKNIYIDTIKKEYPTENFSSLDIDGIKIDKLVLYAKGMDIVNLLDSEKNIKYKTVFNGTYKYIGV